jgi:ABC-type lipoprotein export system ATPase subunit
MTEARRQAPLLSTEALSRVYPDGRVQALADVSLSIDAGEYVAIMGPSGSGKSTLLNLLGGLDRPTSGRVCFQGMPLPAGKALDAFRARHVGFVFQSFCLLPMLTALENVQIPLFEGALPRSRWRQRAQLLLESVGLGHRCGHLPSRLSVGERQRVAIARALANDPELILADEPTGNLDSARAEEILDLFDKLRAEFGKTLVVVTHGQAVARRAERLIELYDGRLRLQTSTGRRRLAEAA